MVVEFPSVEHAERRYDSDEYQPLKETRMSAGDVDAVVVQGLNA